MHANIANGMWPEHYQLQAEVDLSEELGVNRGTIRKAIKSLIDEGLLVRIHGRGTFVASTAIEQPLAESLITFSEALTQQNIAFETEVIEQKVIPADGYLASMLGVEPGDPVFYLKRIRLVKGEPVILMKNYVVYRYCNGIENIDFKNKQLFEVLEGQYHLEISWGRRAFEASIADHEIGEALGIAECDPVMYTQQIVHLDDDHPVELSDLWTRGDAFRVSAVVKRDRKMRIKHFHEYTQNDDT